ncbi:hypothetical protein [Bradyrhizobium ottawaense]
MKIGDLAECAIWLEGTETDAMLKQWATDCPFMMANTHEPKLKLGPVDFEIKRPGQDRVPPVPDHVKGPDVRLLVATAEVLGFEQVRKESFLSELSEADLVRLRASTRKAHGRQLPDNVCDQIIERLGPVAAGVVLH